MPNRYVREDAIESEAVNLLSWQGEVFFRRLINRVDDFGRYTANRELLRASIFPLQLNKVSGAEIGKLLLECEQAGLLSTWKGGDGKEYLVLQKWEKGRAKESKYPSPPARIREHLQTYVCKRSRKSADSSDSDSDSDSDRESSESKVTTHKEPPVPPVEPSPSLEISGGDPVREALRQDKDFCASWVLWKQHLADLGKPMVSRGQETAVLRECGRNGVLRSCEVVAYSISKGARNLIWDAPKAKRKPSEPPSEVDPPGWKRWLEEAYPNREYIAFSNAPETVQSEFRHHTKHSR